MRRKVERIAVITAQKCAGKTCIARKLVKDGLCAALHTDEHIIRPFQEKHGLCGKEFRFVRPKLDDHLDDVRELHERWFEEADGARVLVEGHLYYCRSCRYCLYDAVPCQTPILFVELSLNEEETLRGLRGRKPCLQRYSAAKQRKKAQKYIDDWKNKFEEPNVEELSFLKDFKRTTSTGEAESLLRAFFGR